MNNDAYTGFKSYDDYRQYVRNNRKGIIKNGIEYAKNKKYEYINKRQSVDDYKNQKEWHYHDFVSKYDTGYTKKLKKKMKKFHEYRENSTRLNRYELHGKEYDQSTFENPRYKINTSDHGKDYINFDGENLYFNDFGEMNNGKDGQVIPYENPKIGEYNQVSVDIHGNPISQEEMEEAQDALRSLKQKYAKKNSSKYEINESDKSTNYSEEESKFEFKDYSNKPNISFEKLNLSEIKKNEQSLIDDEMQNDYSYLFEDFDEKKIQNDESKFNENSIDMEDDINLDF